MYKEQEASVFNPSHYRSHPSGVECIDVIRNMPFSQGNAIKYCWRAGMKDEDLQDLTKALWCINDCLNGGVETISLEHNRWDNHQIALAYNNLDRWSVHEPAGYRRDVILYLGFNMMQLAKLKLEEWIESIKVLPSQD